MKVDPFEDMEETLRCADIGVFLTTTETVFVKTDSDVWWYLGVPDKSPLRNKIFGYTNSFIAVTYFRTPWSLS